MAGKGPPNPKIDSAIADLMKQLGQKKDGMPIIPPDVAIKVINTAITWEKVKHQIDDAGSYDPEDM